jgi:bifunctional DNA-binding transcriptional regulator/antitoxin component of YhaV-PrlF toxin-antitoxin module
LNLREQKDKIDLKREIDIVKTFGQCCNLVIPKTMAEHYGINFPGHVVLEYREDGIFLKKLDLSKGDIKD